MKRTIIFLALMLPTLAFAQWRIGANVGLSYNHPTIDKQYMTDLVYKDRWGVTFGLMGQYDFNDWLGVRAELDWTQKNYRQTRVVYDDQNYKYTNNYLLMPVMASFGFGGEKLRGFCNVGVYGGYWLNSHRKGMDFHNVSDYTYSFSEDVDFEDDRDQRWDCGFEVALSRFKRGLGRYDYSPLSPFKVKTLEADHETITEPIVILANCGSISMAEMTTLGCQSLPNGSLIGKRTHGGLCSLSKDPSIYYQNYAGIVGEQDKTPVWLYIPQMVTMSKEKQIFEGVGLTPDIEVDFDITLSESTGRDTQLERALQFLRTGN